MSARLEGGQNEWRGKTSGKKKKKAFERKGGEKEKREKENVDVWKKDQTEDGEKGEE
jgi:hypothetical protein